MVTREERRQTLPDPVAGSTWIPNIVTDDPTLSVYDKGVYMLVAAADQQWGICAHGDALLAYDAGCSVKRVRQSIALLAARRLIVRGSVQGRKGWHAPLDIVNRAIVAATGAVLVTVEKDETTDGC